ncbi:MULTISPECIES: MFS transporter [Arthrobacter]|nr:MFS transporter [Arthrobacter psychrochitiniphilus]NYG18254.1 MFS family permease [Arthrobacter psychrochitiniphilus]
MATLDPANASVGMAAADPAAALAQLPEHPQPPPVSRSWLWYFSLAWFGFWLLVMLPGQFMVAKISAMVAPEDKVSVTSFLIAETAIVILLSVPVIGVLCDRSNFRFGRRRTWALMGFAVAAVPFSIIGLQSNWAVIAILVAIVALGEAAVLVALSAMIADQVPTNQRGRASAAMGVPQVLALAIGMVLVTMLVTSVPGSWALIGVLGLLCALPFLLRFTEPPVPEIPASRATLRHAITLPRPKAYPGYYWAMTSRVMIHSGNLVGTTYLLFFLSDVLEVKSPDDSLLVLILIYLVACGFTSWLGGVLSDKWGKRRVFIGMAAGLQGAAALLLAVLPTWEASMVAAVLLGLGFGMFLSVDQALVTDLLPNAATRGRDLGLINTAQHIPIAPIVGWLVLSFAGYRSLYVVAALIMIAGGIAVYRIRNVR